MNKKMAYLLAMSMMVTGGVSSLYAQEHQVRQEMYEFSTFSGNTFYTSSSGAISADKTAPIISNVRTEIVNSRTCLVVHVKDTETGIKSVVINNSEAASKNRDTYEGDYYVEITGSGLYSITVKDRADNQRTEQHNVTINDGKKPEVYLSQTFKNGHCYLVIDAKDNGSIVSVTVNGSAITFDAEGGVENYKVTKSQKYTVVVKDAAGNITTEKLDVDVEEEKPSLTVDKILKEGKWYLSIKANPSGSTKISKVTVNNSKISFNKTGGTVEYVVPSTGNYTVVVTDSYNQQASQTVYVDTVVNSDSYKPTLSVTQKDVGGVICLAITAQPSNLVANNKLSKVTVNGISTTISSTGGSTDYPLATSGSYTVIATDVNGNTTSQTVYVTVPTINTTPQTSTNTSTGTASNVVFTLNQASWSRNGVTEKMDAAPIARSGRIYIPIRYVAYALNIDASKVVWNANAKSVVIYDGSNVINVPLNSKNMTVNGVAQTMEAAAISYKNRVYIPISQVAKAFSGVNLTWDNAKKQATVVRK